MEHGTFSLLIDRKRRDAHDTGRGQREYYRNVTNSPSGAPTVWADYTSTNWYERHLYF